MKSFKNVLFMILSFNLFSGLIALPSPINNIHQTRRQIGSLSSLGNVGNLTSGGLSGLLGGGGLSSFLGTGGLSNLFGTGGLSGLLGTGGLSSFLGSNGLSSLLGSNGLSSLLGSGELTGLLGTRGLGNTLTGRSMGLRGRASSTDGCNQYKIISARGTGELQGAPTGLAGFVSGVLASVSGGLKYEVVYPATVDYLNGPIEGASDAINYITQQHARCPNQLYILSGYSEGAMVITQLMNKSQIPSSSIAAIVLYGNPYFRAGAPQNACSAKSGSGIASATGIQMPSQFASIVFDCCALGDLICQTMGTLIPHLTYPGSQDERLAIGFASAKLQNALKGSSGR